MSKRTHVPSEEARLMTKRTCMSSKEQHFMGKRTHAPSEEARLMTKRTCMSSKEQHFMGKRTQTPSEEECLTTGRICTHGEEEHFVNKQVHIPSKEAYFVSERICTPSKEIHSASKRQKCESDLMARLSGIVEESIVDGPGLRFVVFFQGCPHRCRGCHNPETHDFCKGYKKPVSKIMKDLFKNPLLSGLTLSGGEPFAQAESAYMLAKYAHDMSLDTITYTGFLFEELLEKFSQIPFCAKLLRETDTLIDGPFILEKRTLSLRFRGSKNQRIIDPKLSLERGVVVEKDF